VGLDTLLRTGISWALVSATRLEQRHLVPAPGLAGR